MKARNRMTRRKSGRHLLFAVKPCASAVILIASHWFLAGHNASTFALRSHRRSLWRPRCKWADGVRDGKADEQCGTRFQETEKLESRRYWVPHTPGSCVLQLVRTRGPDYADCAKSCSVTCPVLEQTPSPNSVGFCDDDHQCRSEHACKKGR
jgi:hypothetical protein